MGNKKKSIDLIDTKEEIKVKAIEENLVIEKNLEEVKEETVVELINEPIVSESIEEKNEPVSEAPKANRKAQEPKKVGKVIGLGKISVIVADENGNSMRLYNKPDAKIGDIVEL